MTSFTTMGAMISAHRASSQQAAHVEGHAIQQLCCRFTISWIQEVRNPIERSSALQFWLPANQRAISIKHVPHLGS
jgi:hypothetical protein